MKRKLSAGLTSTTIPIFIADTSSTTGAGLSGLTSGSAGLVCEYRRQGQATWTTVTLSAGTLGTWSSGGFVSDGALAGAYEVGVPDAALAAGARWVAIRLRGATNMLACLVEIELDAVNYQDSVRFGLTALPNATVSGVGGLLTAPTTANTGLANTTQLAGQTVTAGAGVTFPASVGTSTYAGGAVASVTGSVGSIATGGIAATSFAAGAINAAAIATDAIGAAEIASDAVTKIQTGLATPTNITGGTITTVTNLTNLPTIPANWLTAAGIAVGALNGKGDWSTTGAAMTLTSGERNSIADATLGRSVATIESTAAEWSLASLILAAFESSISGTTWTIKRTDGTTLHLTKTVATNAAADPITGVS